MAGAEKGRAVQSSDLIQLSTVGQATNTDSTRTEVAGPTVAVFEEAEQQLSHEASGSKGPDQIDTSTTPESEVLTKRGVIASIIEFLQEASEDNPITKEEIHAKLVQRFPDRDKDKMAKTVSQSPYVLKRDGYALRKVEHFAGRQDAYWIDVSKTSDEPQKQEDSSSPERFSQRDVAGYGSGAGIGLEG